MILSTQNNSPTSKNKWLPLNPLPIAVDTDLHKVAEVDDDGDGRRLEPFCSEPEAEPFRIRTYT